MKDIVACLIEIAHHIRFIDETFKTTEAAVWTLTDNQAAAPTFPKWSSLQYMCIQPSQASLAAACRPNAPYSAKKEYINSQIYHIKLICYYRCSYIYLQTNGSIIAIPRKHNTYYKIPFLNSNSHWNYNIWMEQSSPYSYSLPINYIVEQLYFTNMISNIMYHSKFEYILKN